MYRIIWLALGLAVCARASLAQETNHPATKAAEVRMIVVRAQWLIDGTADKPRHDMEIVIRGNRIVEVRPANSHPSPAGADVIDLGAATVLPGLIDTHTHIFLQGEDPAAGGYDVQLLKSPASYRAARAVVSARRALEQGFTSIRDMETEGAGYGDVGIKQAINEGIIAGPRMWVCRLRVGPGLGRCRWRWVGRAWWTGPRRCRRRCG